MKKMSVLKLSSKNYWKYIFYLIFKTFFLVIFHLGSLVLWDIETREKKFIESERNGFSNFACSHKHNKIACIESGLNPKIHFYHY